MGGSLLVVVAIALQALANGLLSDNLSGSESVLLSFIAFSVSAATFGCVGHFRRAGDRSKLRGKPLRVMALLNVATAVTFLGFYWSLSLIPAPLASAMETGIGPLALTCLRLRQSSRALRLRGLGIGILTLALALTVAGRVISVGHVDSLPEFVAGLGIAAVAGVSAATIAVLSHRFGQMKVSPVQVTAHRFHLTYLIALSVLVFRSQPLAPPADSRLVFIVAVAVLGAALPLYVLQVGMQRTPPMAVTLLASAVPGLTYLMASAAGGQKFDALTFLLINGSLGVAFLGPVFMRRSQNEGGLRSSRAETLPPLDSSAIHANGPK